jgi:hypothetical protein
MGYYEVVVEAFDLFNDPVGTFSDVLLLEPGEFHDFSFYHDDFVGGSYDVWTAPASAIGDVDFFKFTGLTSGASFTVQTADTGGTNIDTYLGWFDSGGGLISANDDIDADNDIYQSRLTGTVPANGELVFAVSGFGDEEFDGAHGTSGIYDLQLELEADMLTGDYNADGSVNAADYVVWRKDTSIGPYAAWKSHFGEPSSASLNQPVPEPASSLSIIVGVVSGLLSTARSGRLARKSGP